MRHLLVADQEVCLISRVANCENSTASATLEFTTVISISNMISESRLSNAVPHETTPNEGSVYSV